MPTGRPHEWGALLDGWTGAWAQFGIISQSQ